MTTREQLAARYALLMEHNGNDGRIAGGVYYDHFTKEELAELRRMVQRRTS